MPLPRAIVDLDSYHDYTNHLIYGDTGAGKTPLLGTAPNAIFLAMVVEQGLISAKRTHSTAKVWPIHSWEDAIEAYTFLAGGDHPFENVLVDGLSSLQDILLRDIVDSYHRANPAKRSAVVPAQGDYLEQQLKLKRWVGEMNELPMNCWYSALAMRKDDEDAEKIVLPLITGKDYEISQKICAMMHTVSYLEVPDETSDDRQLLFARRGPYFAKDRLMVMGRTMKQPSVPKILQKISEGGGKRPPARPTGKVRPAPRPPIKRSK